MMHKLPNLPYKYNELEPHFDKETMEIHHSKHHATYISKLNDALKNHELADQSIEELVKSIDENTPLAIRNNGGGHFNHSLFWDLLTPENNSNNNPDSEIFSKINEDFGSFTSFKAEFEAAATTRFGSGWAWLCLKDNGKLAICSTPNQDNPYMKISECPAKVILLGLDVWEHAYYLKYQNKRPDYIKAFWNIVNWNEVNKKYVNNI